MEDKAGKKKAARDISARKEVLGAKKIVVGFDGFVDEIIHVVNTKHSKDSFTRVETIEAFGKRILSAAGKSSNIELVPVLKKLGGNGPLMSIAAASLGPHVSCIGLLGYPAISEVFKPLVQSCQVISIGEPGHTDALEFSDGKLMMGKLNTIPEMCWERILNIMGEEAFAKLLTSADLVACTNWTMLTEMKEILDNIIRLVPSDIQRIFFFDLADPEKRPRKEVEEVIGQIQELNALSPCILGLNLREAEQISQVLGIEKMPEDGVDGLRHAVSEIGSKLNIYGTAIHSVSFAGANIGGAVAAVEGPYCPSPKITTGAGDHFNGGFSSAILAGLQLQEALYVGVATSGWYVRNGGPSPSLNDVAGLLNRWADGRLSD